MKRRNFIKLMGLAGLIPFVAEAEHITQEGVFDDNWKMPPNTLREFGENYSSKVKIKNDGWIGNINNGDIDGWTDKVYLEGDVVIEGDLTVNGNLTIKGGTVTLENGLIQFDARL